MPGTDLVGDKLVSCKVNVTLALLSVFLLTSTGLSYLTRGVAAGIMLISIS